jgi:hypothetical protein
VVVADSSSQDWEDYIVVVNSSACQISRRMLSSKGHRDSILRHNQDNWNLTGCRRCCRRSDRTELETCKWGIDILAASSEISNNWKNLARSGYNYFTITQGDLHISMANRTGKRTGVIVLGRIKCDFLSAVQTGYPFGA